jgi:hypothetical protein
VIVLCGAFGWILDFEFNRVLADEATSVPQGKTLAKVSTSKKVIRLITPIKTSASEEADLADAAKTNVSPTSPAPDEQADQTFGDTSTTSSSTGESIDRKKGREDNGGNRKGRNLKINDVNI